jgi:hypothetical protein
MDAIHCHACGGFISDARAIDYRLAPSTAGVAEPHTALCECVAPVLYGAPPGHMSSPGMPAVGYAVRKRS